MAYRGTIFFDGGCGMCSAGVRRWEKVVQPLGFDCVPLQDVRASRALNVEQGFVPGEIKLLTADQRVLGGVDVFTEVSRHVWWGFWFHLLMQVPWMREVAGLAYLPVARYRQRISSVCGLRPMLKESDRR